MADVEIIDTVEVTSATEATSFDITIPGTYDDLRIFGVLRTAGTDTALWEDCHIRFNPGSDPTSAYTRSYFELSSSSLVAGNVSSGTGAGLQVRGSKAGSAGTSYVCPFEVFVPDYANTTDKKQAWIYNSVVNHGTSATYYRQFSMAGLYNDTAAITTVRITTGDSDNILEHSMISVYGIKNNA